MEIKIDVPDEIGFMKDKIKPIEWSFLATKILQERLKEVIDYNRILSKSKASEEDVEELSGDIKGAVWDHYSKYA